MGRRPDPARKPELLEAAVRWVAEHGIGDLSLRPLAQALGVSTYSLVYHFGSKEGLLREVVAHVESRQRAMIAGWSDASLGEGLRRYWTWSLAPENRGAWSIAFDAATAHARDPARFRAAVEPIGDEWIRFLSAGFRQAGLDARAARREATLLAATVFGLQLDLLLTGDVARLNDAVEELARRLDASLATRRPTRSRGSSGTRARRRGARSAP